MTMWCSSNWAELLQPTPLSIALLGAILCTASSVQDFSEVSTEYMLYVSCRLNAPASSGLTEGSSLGMLPHSSGGI